MFSPQTLVEIVQVLVPMILSLSVHEFAHAFVAYRLGDDTAMRQGRMTLNPMAHIDFIGTIVIPVVAVVTASAMGGLVSRMLVGWARPVPINPLRFKRTISMRAGMMLSAAAGPLSNVLLAVLAAMTWGLLLPHVSPGFEPARPLPRSAVDIAVLFSSRMLWVNVTLAIFNLLPIPPLDGSRLLPRRFDEILFSMSRYSFMLIVLFLISPARVIIDAPINACANALAAVFGVQA